MREEFDRLYETYHNTLFQYLFYMVRNREVAEELVQEVYIKVLHSYQSFKGKSSEKTWLYSVAKHVGIDWIRGQSRKKRKIDGQQFEWSEREYEIHDHAPLPEEILLQKDELQQIYKKLQLCSEDQQQVIILRYIQSLSISETADVLGWTESKVKTTQHRAIKALKKQLMQDDFDVKEASE
ncbi:RNA polymerase sigma factor SigX [Evansella cellulosilytica]|uniref:RNA polymerase sigma factor n=1 Tax=Evansella cellulosilytica (strain ATCC 21833 / DSM 2522 / FERM P-1141 / JCM 9156 / N-4) TaxID=649639 RepID=E6TV29_EVAC2|nr:RNA polymerase sigma factor SigX [Evansella cellulosilytica]ADU28612.1 RNA polymerase, sigma-24 subunit, ECF subfamily [Evansella cellulosilytica DSM 2522]